MIRRPWTEADDAALAQCYRDGIQSPEIAARLGRPRGSIHCRAVKLGIAKKAQRGDQNPVWIAIKEICADGQGRTVRDLAIATGEKEKNVERLFYVRRDQNQAHIVDYEPSIRGTSRPMWLPVRGQDVPRPAPTDHALAQKVRREMRKAELDQDLTPDMPTIQKNSPAPRFMGGQQHEIIRAMYGMGVAA